MKYRSFYLPLLIFTVISCNEKTVNKTTTSLSPNNTNQVYSDILKQEIILVQDPMSYSIFLDISAQDTLNYEALSMSIYMAEKGESSAKLRVFEGIVELFNNKRFYLNKFAELSESTKEFALSNLTDAATMNETQARRYLVEIYQNGIGVPKQLNKSDSVLTIMLKEKYFLETYKRNNAKEYAEYIERTRKNSIKP